ncbi:MAG TPA: hypothetical protein VGC21_12540 [Telluria sp.]
MRYQNGLIGIMAIVLAAVTTLGSVYSGSFPQASQAESAGFDALAHNLFADEDSK